MAREGRRSPSPVVAPDEEVITTRGWKRNQGCLEGIKEWENRIQSASWSLGHITASGHSLQMPCIFQRAAAFPIPSLGEFKVSTSLYTVAFGRVIGRSSERQSNVAAQEEIRRFLLVLRLNQEVQWGAMGQCVSFVVAFHPYFHVLFLKSLMVIISDNTTNNISLLSHAQHLQRFFTFMTSPETLRNKESMSYHAHILEMKTEKIEKGESSPR